MNGLLYDLTLFQQVLFVIAASSTIILIIQTILSLIGMAGDNDFDAGESELDVGDGIDGVDSIDTIDTIDDIDFSDAGDVADTIDIAGTDSADTGEISTHPNADSNGASSYDSGLRLFTVKGIMAFLMIGSWVGFLISRAGIHEGIALVFAMISGTISLYFIARIMQMLLSLQEDGTLKIKNALGQIGQVYIRIPGEEKGAGKVNVTVQAQLCEFDAVTEQSETIKTGEMVYVTDIRAGNVLVVEKVEKE